MDDGLIRDGYVSRAESEEPKIEVTETQNPVLKFIIRHPLIVFLILAFPISYLVTPLKTAVFGIMGLFFLGMILVNTCIIYLYGQTLTSVEIGFQKTFLYMIPVSIILVYFGGIFSFTGLGAFMFNGFILLYLFKFEIPIRTAVLVNVLLFFADLIYSLGLVFLLLKMAGIQL